MNLCQHYTITCDIHIVTKASLILTSQKKKSKGTGDRVTEILLEAGIRLHNPYLCFPGSSPWTVEPRQSEYLVHRVSGDVFQPGVHKTDPDIKPFLPLNLQETGGSNPMHGGARRSGKDVAQSKILLCEFCDASFASSGGLSLHKATMHFKRAFVCTFCDKRFTRKENLTNHLLVHQTKTPVWLDFAKTCILPSARTCSSERRI